MIKETENKDKNDEVSGYAIYSNIQKQRIVVNNLPEFYPELPDGKFDIRPALGLWWKDAV